MSLFSKPCVTLTVPSSQASARGGYEGRARYPPFKKKHGDQAAPCAGTAFKWEGKSLTLAGMRTPLDIRWSRPLPQRAQPTTVTVTKDRAHRYFVSILVEEDIKALPGVNKQVGLDPGLKRMVITGDGESHGNPKFLKDEKKLAKAHRRLARKKKGSKNRARARRSRKLARLHARIVDKRRDYQHKLTAKIVRENQVVCMETLQIKNMLKNHSLAKAMSDVG